MAEGLTAMDRLADLTPPLAGSFPTLADAFAAAASQHGDREAYVEPATGERMTFGDWFRRADALAAALVARGVAPGDVVAILLPASIDYAVAYGAITLAGAVVTGLNPRLGDREVASILERSRPAAVVVDPSVFAQPTGDAVRIPRSELADIVRGAGLGAARPHRDPSDAACIIWTSGTTGMPKGAWFDHRNLHAAVASAGAIAAPYDVRLVGTPFAHAGYMSKMWEQLAWAMCTVIAPTPWTAAETLRLLVEERITVAAGVPTQWAKLLDEPGIADADLSRLRIGVAATAPAPPELVERVAATIGCALVVRYAMTESPSITGTMPTDLPDVQYRTVGRPQSGMTVQIVADDGRPVAAGQVGRVQVLGDCVMRGYWGDDTLTREALGPDGWLTSTDLGRFDDAGNLVLVGREGDMYIRGGYNVHPLEVETVLTEHPDVDAAAVVGTPAPAIGQIGVAFVVSKNPPSLAELRTWVSDRLADYKVPDRLVVLDALPLTAMMKVDKVELGHRAAQTSDDRASRANDEGRKGRE